MTDAPPPSDAELLALVRTGDRAAYEELYLRHREVAHRYARRLAGADRADDLCAEAFTKIFDLVQRGKGPDLAFRAYLLTTVRTSYLNALRSSRGEDLVPDHEPANLMTPVVEDPEDRFDREAIYRAFTQLPERWQRALWLTAVEGRTTEEASEQLGITPNAVASLTFRARAGLRQAYLAAHLQSTDDPRCRTVAAQLPSYLRDRLTSRRRRLVDEHLATCAPCVRAALELTDVDTRLGALLAPLALTFAGAGAAAGTGGIVAGAKTLLSSLLGNVKAAAVLAAATVGTAAVGVAVIQHDPAERPRGAAAITVAPSATPGPARPSRAPRPTPSSTPPPTRSAAPDPIRPPRPSARPSTRPTPTSSSTPAPGLAIGTATESHVRRNGARWDQVALQVTGAPLGSTLVVTTDRTIQAAEAVTPGTGWSCDRPLVTWFDGATYATSTISCSYVGDGSAPLVLAYNVLTDAGLVARVSGPPGYLDRSSSDNTLRLLLRD